MSGHAIFLGQHSQATIGWDAGLSTYFLRCEAAWFGTTFEEYTEPHRLVRFARRYGYKVPTNLVAILLADRERETPIDPDEITAFGIPRRAMKNTAEAVHAAGLLAYSETLRGRFERSLMRVRDRLGL